MKIQKIISIKELAAVVLIISLLTIVSCGNQEESSAQENSTSSVSQNNVEAPKMDIFAATFMGDIKAVRQHIKAGTDLNAKDEYGSSPLIIAATFNKTEIAKALIDAGADLQITNNEGGTVLHIAAFFCRTEIVEALLTKGTDKTKKNNYGATAEQTVSGSFTDAKPIYDQISKDLGPFGFKLNYEQLETSRPKIAEMLK